MDRFDEKKEYYAILGASEDASPAEIDRLYKRLAHQRHPDRGGDEEEMKALNEAYQVLRDDVTRSRYDAGRRRRGSPSAAVAVAPTAGDVGVSGQLLSALLCLVFGFMLLLLVRFNGLWFLWPLSILALGVILFGVLIAHNAMTNARASFCHGSSRAAFSRRPGDSILVTRVWWRLWALSHTEHDLTFGPEKGAVDGDRS